MSSVWFRDTELVMVAPHLSSHMQDRFRPCVHSHLGCLDTLFGEVLDTPGICRKILRFLWPDANFSKRAIVERIRKWLAQPALGLTFGMRFLNPFDLGEAEKRRGGRCRGGLFLWPFLFTSTWRLGEANWSIIWGSRIYTKVESSAGESQFPLSRKAKKCYPSRIGLELHLVESKT